MNLQRVVDLGHQNEVEKMDGLFSLLTSLKTDNINKENRLIKKRPRIFTKELRNSA